MLSCTMVTHIYNSMHFVKFAFMVNMLGIPTKKAEIRP